MKKIIALLLAVTFTLGWSLKAKAQENGINGLIFGAGGGALLGQAIGRDTEATLLGSAVGSMLGYVIGNEMDKGYIQSGQIYRPTVSYSSTTGRHQKTRRKVYTTHVHHYPVVTQEHRYKKKKICRKTEFLAIIDGYPEKVITTACLQDGRWVQEGTDNSENGVSDSAYYKYKKSHRLSRRGRLYYSTAW